ncbi:MAG: hypothetical protein HY052_04980 [Proteobacteria bacterium]|nr:hypothetical protein [Pseudomonadota bacterium]
MFGMKKTKQKSGSAGHSHFRKFVVASLLTLSCLFNRAAFAQEATPDTVNTAATTTAVVDTSAEQDDDLMPLPVGTLSESSGISGTISAVSQYRLRGITQSNGNPAVQGGIDWSHNSGAYAGIWGSNIDFDAACLETDVYGGYKAKLSDIDLDVGVIGYVYPGASSSLHYNRWEGKIIAGHVFALANVSGGISHSFNGFANSGPATYVSTSLIAPSKHAPITVTGSFGHQWFGNSGTFGFPDYSDWSLGVGYRLHGFDLALKYINTTLNKNDYPNGCGATAVFSISKVFK